MQDRRDRRRLLIYSHDSFGLGHLRRCRAIAHALVDRRPDLQVLILSGSPIIGSFGFRNHVDFVRIPGVIKLQDGDYSAASLDLDLKEILAIRAKIIRHTADAFAPDLFLVDKEPLGLRGEVGETLAMLKARGVPLILGLRDVLDEPAQLAEEWRRKNVMRALADLYDAIWVYGLPQICNAIEGIPVTRAITDKVRYTGYLRRMVEEPQPPQALPAELVGVPYVLVTPGGGGDGADLIDWVLRAYEHEANQPGGEALPHACLLVLGPFMRTALQAEFMARVAGLPRVSAIRFEATIENLLAGAAGIVAMGGYNTFCEILSFDRPAVLVPRTTPRLEQFIRAKRADALGLVRMLPAEGGRDPRVMAAALRALPTQPRPSDVRIPGLLDGLSVIHGLVEDWLATRARRPFPLSLVRSWS